MRTQLKIIAALIALASIARADTLTVTTPIVMAPYVAPGNPEVVFIQGFNPALGTLRSVTISAWLHETGGFAAENLAQGPATYTWQSQAGILLSTSTNVPLVNAALPQHGNSHSLTAYDGALDWGGTSGFLDPLKNDQGFPSIYSTSRPVALNRFVSAGPIQFNVERFGANQHNADSGKGTYQLLHEVGARLVITYVYQSVTL